MTFDEFWHQQPFGWAACDAMTLARKVWDHQQAEIDALMLEFCPDDMTPEQMAEYERHQITAPNADVTGLPPAQTVELPPNPAGGRSELT